jgi:inner membrane protein
LPLSLSEHLGFDLAYALSYLLTLGLIAGYSKALLGRKIALGISSMLSALYGFLYVVLKREDFALLLGALGLFVILAVIMYATRKIDWYAIGRTATNEDSVS